MLWANLVYPLLLSASKALASLTATLSDQVEGTHLQETRRDVHEYMPPSKRYNPVGPAPITGVTRYYHFTISRVAKSPDGVPKLMLLANDQFPGPLIEANWGDMIEVTVFNNITDPEEGTSIHWHGIPQSKTPWYDGVPSVHQCPIAPGQKFTYRFQAEVYGSSWWHSHFSAQYIDGLFGPLIIHGPRLAEYDIDLGPVLLTDYPHTEYFSMLLAEYQIPSNFLPIDNNLINGLNPYNCSLIKNGACTAKDVERATFQFVTGKTHLLRLINAGGAASQKFSIDNHELIVIANDFVPLVPYTTQVVTLGPGQRSDVLIKATGKPTDAVWMRSDIDITCLNVTNYQPNATALVYYPKADLSVLPTSQPVAWESNNCANDPLHLTVPLFPKTPQVPDITINIDITVGVNGSGNGVFYVNNSTLYANYSQPILRDVYYRETNFSAHPDWNVLNLGQAKSVRAIVRSFFPVMHNMHLHGTQGYWVLATGVGEWDGVITNPTNPQRRDGQQMGLGLPEEPTYIVLQWETDNPGVWPFHCHLITHASAGLIMNFIQRPDMVTYPEIPSVVAETCVAWDSYAATHLVPEIDSGLKERD